MSFSGFSCHLAEFHVILVGFHGRFENSGFFTHYVRIWHGMDDPIVPIGFTTWAGYQPWILGYVWKMPKHVFASKSCVLDDVRCIYIYTNTTIICIYIYIYLYLLCIYIYILYIHLDMYMILDILHIWYTVHRHFWCASHGSRAKAAVEPSSEEQRRGCSARGPRTPWTKENFMWGRAKPFSHVFNMAWGWVKPI